MEMALIIMKQTIVMALIMAAGFILYKKEKITLEGSRVLANLLVWLIIPCTLARSFCMEYSTEKLIMLGESFVLAAVIMAVAIAIAYLTMGKNSIELFASAFCNCGFIGIPLVTAAIGEYAVFFLGALLVIFNLLQWSWGASVMKKEKMNLSPKALLSNPFLYAAAIGLFLFVTGLGVKLPYVVSTAMTHISSLNTPVSMLVLGVYLARTNVLDLFKNPRLYRLSVIRMWVIPLVTLGVFMLLPFHTDVRMTLLISAATPVGANVAVYAQMYDTDYPYACQTVALTTLLSIVMMPPFILLATYAFGI